MYGHFWCITKYYLNYWRLLHLKFIGEVDCIVAAIVTRLKRLVPVQPAWAAQFNPNVIDTLDEFGAIGRIRQKLQAR